MALLRKNLKRDDIRTYSESACSNLLSIDILAKSSNFTCYSSRSEELQTGSFILNLLQSGKRVALPKVDKKKKELSFFYITSVENDLESGFNNIMEPKEGLKRVNSLSEIDFGVIPAVSVDAEGNRIGFGGGYFDKYFKGKSTENILCGFVFDFQILEKVPRDSHDLKLDIIVSDRRIIYCGKRQSVSH